MNLYDVRKKLSMGIPLSNINLKVTYYSRVSTDNIKQHSSLINQSEYFDELIKSNKNWTYVKGYIDDGISGTSINKRNNFIKMINDAKKNKFDLIITKEISRFSRNTLDSIKYTRDLLSYGVAVLFVNDNINTILPDSELRLTIMASMAQDEIRRLSERVKFGMDRSIKKGVILGNNIFYGYIKENNDKQAVDIEVSINDEEANVVKRIFNLYVYNDYSINKIVKILNQENVKTSLNKKWNISTISRMISNPKYKGYYCGKKTEIINYMTKEKINIPSENWITYKDNLNITPIVTEKVWNKANIKLKMKKHKSNHKNIYIFSNKIICSNDGYIFHRRKQCKTSDDVSWLCSKYLKEGKKNCDSPNIRESELLKIFQNIFIYLNIDYRAYIKKIVTLYPKEYTSNILKIINDKDVENILINLLLDRIITTKNKEKDTIHLDVYLNVISNANYREKYEFYRGYNTSGTRRYKVSYLVNIFFIQENV